MASELWSKIDQLKQTLALSRDGIWGGSFSSEEKKIYSKDSHRQCLLEKIQVILEQCVNDTTSNIGLLVPNRKKWKNTNFYKDCGVKMIPKPTLVSLGKVKNSRTNKRFGLTLHLLKKIHIMLKSNKYCTKRELYYEDIGMYRSQAVVDSILDDISCMLGTQKIHLHVLTTSKGCISGNLQFKDSEGNFIDISEPNQGHQLPNDIGGIMDISSSAKFILIVEKDAIFQNLIDSNFTKRLHPCIIITGKGFPDVNTRSMVHKLYNFLHIPVLVLVDADPYGIEILCIYAFGSMSLAFDAHNLTAPQIRWLGLLPSDIHGLNLSENDILHLTQHDRKHAEQLLIRPYMKFKSEWHKQVQLLLETNIKAEIESVNTLANDFLTNTYLPKKIKYGGWI